MEVYPAPRSAVAPAGFFREADMNINPTVFIIMVEVLAVESIILIVISALYIRRKLQCRAVLENIFKATESSGAARQQVLENTLKDMFKEGDENASEVAAKLVTAESRFHKRLLATFIEQDHDALPGLFKWTDKLLSPYRTMISDTASELDEVKKASKKKVEKLEHAVETLSREKSELTQELDHTKQELDSILSEYVSAFDKEKQLKEKAAGEKQKYSVKQDGGDGVYNPADEEETESAGSAMEEKPGPTAPDGEAADGAEQAPAPDPEPPAAGTTADEPAEESLEISIEESPEAAATKAPEEDEAAQDNEDEGMLKIADLEAPAPGPDNGDPAPEEAASQAEAAILEDVDIDSLIEANTPTGGEKEEDLPKAAAQS